MAISAFSLFGELKLDRRDFTSGLATSEKQLEAFKKSLGGIESAASRAFQNIGGMMQSLGKGLTVGLTAPLLAIEGAAIKSAVGFDTLRTQLAAATGSTASANTKFKELNKLAQENAGVLTAGAVATYNFLKPLGFAEGTINETIKAFGKLKAANPDVDLQRMATNLGQLFDQGFEQQDVKELVGNFPRALEIMKKAFGLKSSDRKGIAEEMKTAMASGLTREDFFKKFAEGINNDAFLAGVTDPVAVRFEKMKERIMLALEPLGMLILTNLERFAPTIVAFIERLSMAFTALSPTMQMIVTALMAVGVAAGPVIFGIGKLVSAVGSLGIGLPSIGAVAGAIAALGLILTPIIITATFFSQEWLRNWELVKQIFWAGYEAVSGVVMQMLAGIQGFWAEHGSAIMDYLSAWWSTLSTAISQWFGVVAEVLNVVLMAIQGNWSGVWEGILAVTTQVWTLITTTIGNAIGVVGNLIKAFGPILLQGMTWVFAQLLTMVSKAAFTLVQIFFDLPKILLGLIPKFIAAGMQIGSAIQTGIANGIRNFLNPMAAGDVGGSLTSNPFQSLVDSFKNLFAGSGPKAGLEGGLGSSFMTPAITQANTLSTALDKVTQKAKQAKAVIAPKMAAKTAKAVTAAGRSVYGKAVTLAPGGILMDVTPLTPGTVGTPYRTASQDATNEILKGLTTAVQEGKLAIEIIDPNRSTTLGGSSNNVSARYR